MIFDVTLFFVGFVSVIRILMFHEKQKTLQVRWLTKIGTTLLFAVFYLSFEWDTSPVIRSLSGFAVISAFLSLDFIVSKIRNRRLQDQLPFFVQNIVLNMKMGSSFRAAMQSAVEMQTTPQAQKWFATIFENVVFTQQNNPHFLPQLAFKVVRELKSVDQESYQAVSRLENLLLYLRSLSEFRRRSGKALLQVRAQALIIVCLYFAVVLFMTNFIGFDAVFSFLPISAGLMFTGLALVLFFGRRMRWSF